MRRGIRIALVLLATATLARADTDPCDAVTRACREKDCAGREVLANDCVITETGSKTRCTCGPELGEGGDARPGARVVARAGGEDASERDDGQVTTRTETHTDASGSRTYRMFSSRSYGPGGGGGGARGGADPFLSGILRAFFGDGGGTAGASTPGLGGETRTRADDEGRADDDEEGDSRGRGHVARRGDAGPYASSAGVAAAGPGLGGGLASFGFVPTLLFGPLGIRQRFLLHPQFGMYRSSSLDDDDDEEGTEMDDVVAQATAAGALGGHHESLMDAVRRWKDATDGGGARRGATYHVSRGRGQRPVVVRVANGLPLFVDGDDGDDDAKSSSPWYLGDAVRRGVWTLVSLAMFAAVFLLAYAAASFCALVANRGWKRAVRYAERDGRLVDSDDSDDDDDYDMRTRLLPRMKEARIERVDLSRAQTEGARPVRGFAAVRDEELLVTVPTTTMPPSGR